MTTKKASVKTKKMTHDSNYLIRQIWETCHRMSFRFNDRDEALTRAKEIKSYLSRHGINAHLALYRMDDHDFQLMVFKNNPKRKDSIHGDIESLEEEISESNRPGVAAEDVG